jgi:hypothetical protein
MNEPTGGYPPLVLKTAKASGNIKRREFANRPKIVPIGKILEKKRDTKPFFDMDEENGYDDTKKISQDDITASEVFSKLD